MSFEESLPDPVLECAREVFGIPYPFPWQRLIMAGVLDSLLPSENETAPLRKIAVLPTGAGKSLCWMLPAVLSGALTVAVFPLLSLMADQYRRLREASVPAVMLRGGQSRAQRNTIWRRLESGEVNIVLANPEILQNPQISKKLSALSPEFMVVDETHTVSQWGESFRPACADLGPVAGAWNPKAVLALTATAGPSLRERITELLFLGRPPEEALANPDRPAILYGVLPTLSRSHTLEQLVRQEPRPAIVFGPTRASVEQSARMLRFRLSDRQIRCYHAGLEREEKTELEEWFLQSQDGVLCATCAYGMGVDKTNIRTVIHLAPPESLEAYLQESGRAARDGKSAHAWLIYTPEDAGGHQPRRPEDTGESSGASDTSPGTSLATSRTEVARARKAAVLHYAWNTRRCRRELLLEALGMEAEDCQGCDVCGGAPLKQAPEETAILQTVRRNRGRFQKGELARILIGRETAEILRAGLHLTRGFGLLAGWELEDAEEAVDTLLHTGRLQRKAFGLGPFGFFRNKLSPGPRRRHPGSS